MIAHTTYLRIHRTEFAPFREWDSYFYWHFAAFDRRTRLKVTLGTHNLQLYRGLMTKALIFSSLLSGILATSVKVDLVSITTWRA
jgi:hypothetical protein